MWVVDAAEDFLGCTGVEAKKKQIPYGDDKQGTGQTRARVDGLRPTYREAMDGARRR